MEGCWTIRLDHAGNELGPAQPEPSDQLIPVVPCDDAAVERAARMLLRRWCSGLDSWDTLSELQQGMYRSDAKAILGAAGETP